MAKYTALDIAKWFICRANEDVESIGGEYITHLKLQKLLYYAQGSYLAIKDEPLYEDAIQCWEHGPVVPSVYKVFKKNGDKAITKCDDVIIDDETVALLDEVYNVFGQYSAWKLREMTHQEEPWKNTEKNAVINIELIKNYFKDNFIE